MGRSSAPMPKHPMDAQTERGQLINLSALPHGRVRTAQPRRARRSDAVLKPRWQTPAQTLPEPTSVHPGTDGALALLEERAPEELPIPRPIVARNHILLVEDDEQTAHMIREALTLEGESDWDVQVATAGAPGPEVACATPP